MIGLSRTYFEKILEETDRVVELLSECIVIANYLRQIAVEGSEKEVDEVISLVEEQTVIFNSIKSTVGRIEGMNRMTQTDLKADDYPTVLDICSQIEDSFHGILYKRCVVVAKLVDAVGMVYANNEKLFRSLSGLFKNLNLRIAEGNEQSGESFDAKRKNATSNTGDSMEDPESLFYPVKGYSPDSYYFNWRDKPIVESSMKKNFLPGRGWLFQEEEESGSIVDSSYEVPDYGRVSFVYNAAADSCKAVEEALEAVVDCLGISLMCE